MRIVFLSLFFAFALLIAWGGLVRRKRRDLIVRAIEAAGGTVKAITSLAPNYSVLFISSDGDLRHSIGEFSGGRLRFIDNKPYQDYLTDRDPQRPRSPGDAVTLQGLLWVVECEKLPGRKAFVRTIASIAANPIAPVVFKEIGQNSETPPEEKFAAVLQCAKMQCDAARDTDSGFLDLVCKDRPVLVAWRVEGDKPDRVLTFAAAHPLEPAEIASSK